MNENKLQSLFNFLAVLSENFDSGKLLHQSPDYIIEKFEQYINKFDVFKFPDNLVLSNLEHMFISDYNRTWNILDNLNSDNRQQFVNLLIYIKRSGWDNSKNRLPSDKLKSFNKCIGDYSLIKEPINIYAGLHTKLSDFFDKEFKSYPLIVKDISKLRRDFKIDNLINTHIE